MSGLQPRHYTNADHSTLAAVEERSSWDDELIVSELGQDEVEKLWLIEDLKRQQIPRELEAYRRLGAWRITRKLALLQGSLSSDDQPLEALDLGGVDCWVEGRGLWPTRRMGVWGIHSAVGRNRAPNPLPLAPPIPKTEDPAGDPEFVCFLQVASRLAEYLGTPHVEPLLHPKTCHQAWPSKSLILGIERSVVERIYDVLVSEGHREAVLVCVDQMGMGREEANGVVLCARRLLSQGVRFDINEDRAMMLLRLEELGRRARAECDLRLEAKVLQQQGIVMGLGQQPPANLLDALADAAAEVHQGRSATQIDKVRREDVPREALWRYAGQEESDG